MPQDARRWCICDQRTQRIMDGNELQQERSDTPTIRSSILTSICRAQTQNRTSWRFNYSQQSTHQVLAMDSKTFETCEINQVKMRHL